MVFLCETKQATTFADKTVNKLNFEDRWHVNELVGRKGGMLIAWSSRIDVRQVWNNDFCM